MRANLFAFLSLAAGHFVAANTVGSASYYEINNNNDYGRILQQHKTGKEGEDDPVRYSAAFPGGGFPAEEEEEEEVYDNGGGGSVCLVTKADGSGVPMDEHCQNLYADADADDDVALGSVCLHMAQGQLYATFDALPGSGYKLIKTKFWIGKDTTSAPKLSDGSLDLEAFEYFWCDSKGASRWSAPAEDTVLSCDIGELSMIAFAELETIQDDGTKVTVDTYAFQHSMEFSDAWMGWFDFAVSCDCDEGTLAPTTSPSSMACPTTPEVVMKGSQEKECHAIVAGGDNQSMKAGTVCVQVVGQVLDIVFEADENWALLRNQLWVGQGENSLATMPKKKGSDAPDTKKFKNFACDWEGAFNSNPDLICGDLLLI